MVTIEHKKHVANAALTYIKEGCRLGVGTGSTVNELIQVLPSVREKIAAVVASSESTAQALESVGLKASPLDKVGEIDLYIDGADEIDDNRQMIKGGGGALTREKILASVSKQFVVIVDGSKKVKVLGKFPLAVEVIPMARGYVARQLSALGGNVCWRENFVTDNGNWILDVSLLDLVAATEMEIKIKKMVGVIENGLFSIRRADEAIIADQNGIHFLKK